MSIKLGISECEDTAEKYHDVVNKVGTGKSDLLDARSDLKDTWSGDASDKWSARIDVVANKIEQSVSDKISTAADLLDDIAEDAKTLRQKAEALPATLGGSAPSGGNRLVLEDGAAGSIKGDVQSLNSALDKVGPAVSAVRDTLSKLKTCSVSVDNTAESAANEAKGKLDSFSGEWDGYLEGVDALVEKAQDGLSKLDADQMTGTDPVAQAFVEYLKLDGAQDVLYGLVNEADAYGGVPINMATGNFIYPARDLSLSQDSDVAIERMYNSDSSKVGSFGLGWSSIIDDRLIFDDTHVNHLRSDGRRRPFLNAGTGKEWKTADGEEETITYADGSYVLSGAEARQRIFDGNGRLVEVTDLLGTICSIKRDETGKAMRIEAGEGRFIDIEYDGSHVVALDDHTGREVRYAYDGDLLVSVTKTDGAV